MGDRLDFELEAVVNKARQSAVVLSSVSSPEDNYYVVAHGHDVEIDEWDLQKRIAPNPRRKRGTATLRNEASFVAYVRRHKELGTLVVADDNRVTAILNHHGPNVEQLEGDPGWGDHKAVLELKYTPSWTAWLGFADRFIEQEAFAYFLEERIRDVAQPAGAELLEIARDLRVHLDAHYGKAVVTKNGTLQISYEEQATTGTHTGGHVEVPERIVLGLKPFDGGDGYEIPAMFRYRLRDGLVEFKYILGDEAARVFDEAFEEMLLRIGESLELPVLRGGWQEAAS